MLRATRFPTTYEELKTVMDQMVADGTPPWCIGIESGAATGWVATDWMENIMLRTTTPENYDAWVQGKLKFTSPEVTKAAQIMADIWTESQVRLRRQCQHRQDHLRRFDAAHVRCQGSQVLHEHERQLHHQLLPARSEGR